MPTTRHKRTRTRRPAVTTELEKFFISGHAERGSDVVWDLFANLPRIFQAWQECKDSLHRQYKRCLAWRVFETGTIDCFPAFVWVSHAAYERWRQSENG